MSDQLVMPNGRIVTATDVLQMQETNMRGWRLAQARAIELDQLRRQLAEAEGVIQHYQMESHSAAMNHWRERAAAAEAKLALAEQNDRRYRWLRDHPRSTWETCYFKRQFVCKVPVALNTDPFPVSLDTAIDAAIAAGEGGE